MAFYFRTKKLDITTGDPLVIVMNAEDAAHFGFTSERNVHLCWRDVCLFVTVDFSDTEVGRGEIGMFQDVWSKYGIPSDDMVAIEIPEAPKSMESIRKKLSGEKLSYEEIHDIILDIARRRLNLIETTYFATASFSPGFDKEEIYFLTKAMAETGDKLDFTGGDPDKKVVDKHSIGGIPAKGITPILVPIVASFDLIVPNTSSRSITTPAGTSDMLEVIMPVTLSKEEIVRTVAKEYACLVWGGSMELAPADDVLINIERPLHMESYDKFLISIIAKKAAMKVTHLLIDIPYGKGAKVEHYEDVEKVTQDFIDLGKKFGITVEVFAREALSPDGYGVGPVLEIRDVLRIFERHPERPVKLEETAIEMAGHLLELAGAAPPGKGVEMARSKLENGEAEEKFWSIAEAQGAKKRVKSRDLITAEYTHTLSADHSGVIRRIGNREVVKIARALGAPFIKEAGMYLHKLKDDTVQNGEDLVTLYASSPERLELGIEMMEENNHFIEY
jgi:AMP phosphorylase